MKADRTIEKIMNHTPKTPFIAVDAIIETGEGIVLIERKNPPYGWALPGGFVDCGETLETAVCREMKEETGLDIDIVRQFHAYSDPKRDLRHHIVSIIFIATALDTPKAGDDAAKAGIFARETLPEEIAFDHRQILDDYFSSKY